MSDQERIQKSIERLEFFKRTRGYWDNTADVEELDTAIAALHEKLQRQQEQSEPKMLGLQTIYFTPYSCEYCGDHIAIGWAFCPECGHSTKNKLAATEPKAEGIERTLENCDLIKKYGMPLQENGECVGFQTSQYNDEPCETCKRCRLCLMGYHKEENLLSESDWADFGVYPSIKPQTGTEPKGEATT